MNNHIEELPSEHVPRRTVLKVLMLQRNKTLRVVPGSFLQSAPSLTYLDLSNTMIEELPSEIRSLGSLHYLNLSASHINKLPDELSFLTELRYLLVSATICLATMPYGIISKLRKLQILDVFQSKYSSWDAGTITSSSAASPTNSENGSCANLSEFTDLKGLGITVDTVEYLKKLARCDMVWTKRICLKRMETPASLHVLPSSLGKLLGGFDMLRSLQEFMLSTCALLKEIIIDGGSGCREEEIIEYALPELEKLELVGLYNLEQIRFRQVTPNDVFPSLSSVQIFHCYELKNLNWLLQLPQLLHISIHFCEAMKAVIDDDDVEQPIDEIEQEQPVQAKFPLLKTLTIHSLGSLTCLCRGRSVDLPALEILEITQCSNLKQLNIVRPQGNLKETRGGEKWWNDLCWEEDSIREELLPYFKAPRLKCNAN